MTARPVAVAGETVTMNYPAAALLWEVIEGHLGVVWGRLDPDVREQMTPIVRSLQRAAAATSDGRSEGQIAGAVVSSPHELTRKQAAMTLGVSPERVSQLCGEGRLEHRRVGRQLLIASDSVDAELVRRERGAA